MSNLPYLLDSLNGCSFTEDDIQYEINSAAISLSRAYAMLCHEKRQPRPKIDMGELNDELNRINAHAAVKYA